jgi:hypothetical protein
MLFPSDSKASNEIPFLPSARITLKHLKAPARKLGNAWLEFGQ